MKDSNVRQEIKNYHRRAFLAFALISLIISLIIATVDAFTHYSEQKLLLQKMAQYQHLLLKSRFDAKLTEACNISKILQNLKSVDDYANSKTIENKEHLINDFITLGY